jgi:hypothetical protein
MRKAPLSALDVSLGLALSRQTRLAMEVAAASTQARVAKPKDMVRFRVEERLSNDANEFETVVETNQDSIIHTMASRVAERRDVVLTRDSEEMYIARTMQSQMRAMVDSRASMPSANGSGRFILLKGLVEPKRREGELFTQATMFGCWPRPPEQTGTLSPISQMVGAVGKGLQRTLWVPKIGVIGS